MMPSRLNEPISRRTLLRGSAVALAGVGAIAVAGCGGDSTDKSTPSPEPQPTLAPTAASTTTAIRNAVWTPLSAAGAPGPRRDHSLTFNPADGLIYLFGGRTQGPANNELWTYPPARDTWQALAPTGDA